MNNRPKVLCMVDLSLGPQVLDLLRSEVDLDYRPADRTVLQRIIHEFDAFWGHTDLAVDREILDLAIRLKAISSASTGTDHIDKDEAARRGIKVLSITRDYGFLNRFTATAECAWMLLLTCHRHFRPAVNSVLEGQWLGERFCGEQLSERTLGVLGVGRLGRMVVEYGRAFRMRVLGCDLLPFDILGVEPVDFDTLLRKSDAISIHIHMTPENYQIFNAEAFAKMKPGTVLVNTSRGGIIDEAALLAALESGRLAAFGADVIEGERRPDISESPVIRYARDHENVIITPHIGGCTTRSIVEARVFSARKLLHYLKTGEELTC